MGGTSRLDTDLLSNLLALDPEVHNGGPQSVHGRRGWSEERGYLLPLSTPLASGWPVLVRGHWWAFLLNSGGYKPVPRY